MFLPRFLFWEIFWAKAYVITGTYQHVKYWKKTLLLVNKLPVAFQLFFFGEKIIFFLNLWLALTLKQGILPEWVATDTKPTGNSSTIGVPLEYSFQRTTIWDTPILISDLWRIVGGSGRGIWFIKSLSKLKKHNSNNITIIQNWLEKGGG